MNAPTSQKSPELHANRAAWLAVIASILLVCTSLAALIYRWSLPSDGWALEVSPDEQSVLLTRQFLDAARGALPESPRLEPGDRLLAVEGQPVGASTSHLTPTSNWRIGGQLRYTIMRGEEILEVSVPLVHIPLSYLLASLPTSLLDTLGIMAFVVIGIFVFSRRPGSPAAQVLLFLVAVRLAMWNAGLLFSDAPALFGDPFWIGVWNFFNTWVWSGFLFPSLLLFTLVFPRPKRIVQDHPLWVLAALYGLLHLLRLVIGDFWEIGWGLVSVFGLLSIASLVHSYFSLRRDPVAMAQTRWVLTAMIITVTYPALTNIFIVSSGPTDPFLNQPLIYAINEGIYFFLFLLLPLALAVAILRYRLFDIDVIIRRTLQYGLLTALLAVFYFGSVTVLQGIFTALGGSRSPVITVISTLAIAALFNPLRRRLQDFIDRRFYRQKFDAERVLAHFNEAARSETDLQALVDRLVSVVQETAQPQNVLLWLEPMAERRRTISEAAPTPAGKQANR